MVNLSNFSHSNMCQCYRIMIFKYPFSNNQKLRLEYVILVIKEKERMEYENGKRVKSVPVPVKILEQLINQVVNKYLEKAGSITSCQHRLNINNSH